MRKERLTEHCVSKHYGYLNNSSWAILNETEEGSDASSMAILICPPLGHEYTHSFGTLASFADAFNDAGIDSLRLDYSGTGNSAGDMRKPDLIETWLDDLHAAVNLLKAKGKSRIVLLGLRFGAVLATQYLSKHKVSEAILWCPIVDGRALVRDLQMIGQTQRDTLVSGGFEYGDQLLEDLKKIRLKDEPSPSARTLIIDRDDAPSSERLASQWGCDYEVMDGYLRMMRQPQFSEAPMQTAARVCDWLFTSATEDCGTDEYSRESIESLQSELTCKNFKESGLRIQGEGDRTSMFGVLTEPTSIDESHVLLIPNTGAAHHIGPNRLHVSMARSLVKDGYSTYRFDLPNIGEGSGVEGPERNNPYPNNTTVQLQAVINHFQAQGKKKISLIGICSGANLGFLTVLNQLAETDSSSIAHLIMINNLVYHNEENLSSPEIGGGLQKSKRSVLESIVRLLRRVARVGARVLSHVYTIISGKVYSWGLLAETQLANDLIALHERTKLTLIFAGEDESRTVLQEQLGYAFNCSTLLDCEDIVGADHTYTDPTARSNLIGLIRRKLSSGT